MFTGLVEGLGKIVRVDHEPAGVRLAIEPPALFEADRPGIGDSVAINGCCLTVVPPVAGAPETPTPVLEFQAGSETLSKTNLADLRGGSLVNLERALAVGARLGGHFVQGHVDGVGSVQSIRHEDEWVHMTFAAPAELTRLMVPKGSIAVDGVSLTIVEVHADAFRVALIPHTLQATTLGTRTVGDRVNLEADMLGKYVQKLLGGLLEREQGGVSPTAAK